MLSVLGSRVVIITGIVLSTIGAVQVWLACKCCILIDENVKPCLLLATGQFIFCFVLQMIAHTHRTFDFEMILASSRVNKIRNRFHFRVELDLERGSSSSFDRQITKLKSLGKNCFFVNN